METKQNRKYDNKIYLGIADILIPLQLLVSNFIDYSYVL